MANRSGRIVLNTRTSSVTGSLDAGLRSLVTWYPRRGRRLFCYPATKGVSSVISRRVWLLLGCGSLFFTALWAFQKPFRVYPSMEPYDNVPLPNDWKTQAEWVQARLMYPQHPEARFARF